MKFTRQELLIGVIARLLEGARHVAVGVASPIPCAGAMLARRLSGGAMRLSVIGSQSYNFFTDGGRELFDCAAQGRIDAFFLGGGQIDGEANINLIGVGEYPTTAIRWPGSFGSAYLYFLIPRVILFRGEHSRRVLVPKVDFISAPGTSPENVYRPGGPHALVTAKACFSFDKVLRRFRLESILPGENMADVTANTGFEFDRPTRVPKTAPPSHEMLQLIRGPVRVEIAEIYPHFAETSLSAESSVSEAGRVTV